MSLQLSERLREYIERQMREARDTGRGWLSTDGSAIMVQGSIGYSCHLSPEGDAFIEYDTAADGHWIDRSRWAEIEVIVLTARFNSDLAELMAELLPVRPPDATTCEHCAGIGFVSIERKNGTRTEPFLFCKPCHGLGWVSPMFSEGLDEEPIPD